MEGLLSPCTEYDVTIVPWVGEYMAEDDEETEVGEDWEEWPRGSPGTDHGAGGGHLGWSPACPPGRRGGGHRVLAGHQADQVKYLETLAVSSLGVWNTSPWRCVRTWSPRTARLICMCLSTYRRVRRKE